MSGHRELEDTLRLITAASRVEEVVKEQGMKARQKRDALIVEALADGASLRLVGRAAGLEHTQVARIRDRTLAET